MRDGRFKTGEHETNTHENQQFESEMLRYTFYLD